MPSYLFTYHAYSSWMPDRERGYVQRGKGVLPADREKARQYRAAARQPEARFDSNVQQLVISELQTAWIHQRCRGHFIATDSTHVHVLVSWRDERLSRRIRSGLKSSLTRRLNRDVRRQVWFSDGASRKRVRDRFHFRYLVNEYLPSHPGWKWREGRDAFL